MGRRVRAMERGRFAVAGVAATLLVVATGMLCIITGSRPHVTIADLAQEVTGSWSDEVNPHAKQQVLDRVSKLSETFDEELGGPQRHSVPALTTRLIASWWVKDPAAENQCPQCASCRTNTTCTNNPKCQPCMVCADCLYRKPSFSGSFGTKPARSPTAT